MAEKSSFPTPAVAKFFGRLGDAKGRIRTRVTGWVELPLNGFLQRIKERRAEPPSVEAEYLRLIYRNLAVSSPISLALVAYMANQVDPVTAPNARPWAALYGIYLCLRWLVSVLYLRQRDINPQQLRWWSNWSVLMQGTAGLLLGGLALFVMPSMELYAQVGMTMVVLILTSAMAFSLSGRWIDTLVFAPPVYLSFAWVVALQDHPYAHGVGLLTLGLFVLHLYYANGHRKSILQGFAVARHSADLARELQVKSTEFEEVASARSRLLATVSHDLRQPAHAIGLLSERALDDPSFTSVKETLRDLNALSQSLSASLTTLMDLTRLDAGLVQPRIGPVSLSQVLSRVEAEFDIPARTKGLALTMESSNAWVLSDPMLLHGVLTNLVSNAIKYTRQGRVDVRVSQQGGAVQVQVIDTGVGIHADKLDLIFKEFIRLDASDAGTEGLGLGLSIVRRYASLLAHQLSVQSQPGKGSSFSVALQCTDPPASPMEQIAVSGGLTDDDCLGDVHVLVIDNVELLLMSLSKTLVAWGSHVQTAHNMAEALRCVGQQWPDLLITDFHLGDREPDGLELIKTLRLQAQQAGLPHLPALLMTGDVSAQLERKASELGVQILHKPVRPRVLQASLMTLTGRSGVQS